MSRIVAAIGLEERAAVRQCLTSLGRRPLERVDADGQPAMRRPWHRRKHELTFCSSRTFWSQLGEPEWRLRSDQCRSCLRRPRRAVTQLLTPVFHAPPIRPRIRHLPTHTNPRHPTSTTETPPPPKKEEPAVDLTPKQKDIKQIQKNLDGWRESCTVPVEGMGMVAGVTKRMYMRSIAKRMYTGELTRGGTKLDL